jgi:hypothetical protein
MGSLLAALWGSLPREAMVAVNRPQDIRRARDRFVRAKLRCMKVSALLLVAGFAILLGGLLAMAW